MGGQRSSSSSLLSSCWLAGGGEGDGIEGAVGTAMDGTDAWLCGGEDEGNSAIGAIGEDESWHSIGVGDRSGGATPP